MSDSMNSGTASGQLKPHNGNTVLVLGILGLVVCFVCGIIAWVMGTRDIKEMDDGTMDPSGRDATNAGKVCGMISSILAMVGVGIGFIVMIFSIIAAVGVAGYRG